MKDYIIGNKEAWEEAYDLAMDSFKHISEIISKEPFAFLEKEIIDIARSLNLEGKDIAQICCNNGREIISLGYHLKANKIYGFDLASNMINDANKTSTELALNHEFICTNAEEISDDYRNSFDCAFILIGALIWFDDLHAFLKNVSKCIKPNGHLVIIEGHPIAHAFAIKGEESFDDNEPCKIVRSYWNKEPDKYSGGMVYMTEKQYKSKTFTDFAYTLSDVINALSDNGLTILHMEEYNRDMLEVHPELDGKNVPLTFSIISKKSA